MRDTHKESTWTNHPIIGYVPLNENDEPYQPILGEGHNQRKKPVTVYSKMCTAVTQSPVNRATEVRMFVPIEVNHENRTIPHHQV